MRAATDSDEILLPTEGGCMRPWLWPGGTLHIRRCTVQQLERGDIAVWFDGERLLSHRVVELRDDGSFVTRGDLSADADPVAAPNQLLGRAVGFSWGPLSYALDSGWAELGLKLTPSAVRAARLVVRALRRSRS